MIKIGTLNTLKVIKKVDFGFYLDGEDWGEILLPKREAPEILKIEEMISVFLYHDSEDRLIATTKTPKAMLGQAVALKVIDKNSTGIFLDWGLTKDLLLPKEEQIRRLEIGDTIVVFIFQDEKDRLVASMKLRDFMQEESAYLKQGQAVELLISNKTELGYRAVIEQHCLGMLYHNEIFQVLNIGDVVQGYIKQIRADGKVDLCLQQKTQASQGDLMALILKHLKQNKGISTLTDKSTPEQIKAQFKVSKASYKKALGRLYKLKKIDLDSQQIRLRI